LGNFQPRSFSIRIHTQKTGALVEIPIIFDWLETMLNDRGWKFPKIISSQRLNTNFKAIGKLAGLNRLVHARVKQSNFWVLKDVPIHQALSSHIGRRAFATNLITRRYPLTMISKMLGHSSLETLKIYEQLNESETAAAVANMYKGGKMSVSL